MYRKSISAILAIGLVLSSGSAYAQQVKSAPNGHSAIAFDNKVLNKINVDNMYNTIAYLSEQPREAGTEGEVRAVKYIESQFKSLGLETTIQPFPIYDTRVNHVIVQINGNNVAESPKPFSGSVSKKVTAPLVYIGTGLPEEIGDLTGKIALIERGGITFIEKVQNALEKGAVGVLMYNNSSAGNSFGQVQDGQNIPAVAITRATGLQLVEQLKTTEVEATLDVDIEKIEKTSYNVIASLKPNKNKDTGQIVTVGSHHDSVPGGPGANDDASGVSAVLELARVLSKTPIDTEIRFMTFGSEERGMVGSSYYAASLSKDEVSRIQAHFQMDMIGGRDAGEDNPAGGLIMYTIDGKKNLVTDLGAAAGARIRSETIPYGQLGRSDHQPFHELGIPAALFIHSPVEPWYHKPTDTLDKISKEKLQQVAEIVGASVYQIARPDTPALVNATVAQELVDYPFENRPVD
ncbi:M28 family peptidase [Bacillus massiliigorillae]|uniref:M28 family peptidase n=1 Tax=Bacillus massiliigorillae TaxID=1243664 RepID=UPI0003AAD6E0|nr:M28 family peptidase [Bacillus massiliigorillae]